MINGWSAGWSATWGKDWADWTFDARWGWAEGFASTCAHPLTMQGAKLAGGCSPLATRVCAADPYCCNGYWDGICVDRARNMGDDVTGAGHSVLEDGPPLTAGHSECAAHVCSRDSYCCTTSWDPTCVDEAAEWCASRFLHNTRLEEGRVMVDMCVEARIPGYPACPVDPNGTMCCTRALVLKGVYTATEVPGNGRQVRYEPLRKVTSPRTGALNAIRATLVPDPCVRAGGQTRCADRQHQLWQAAGPGGPIYPDCGPAGSARPCTAGWDRADQKVEWIWTGSQYLQAPYRGTLVSVLSALITTNGRYKVDIRRYPGTRITGRRSRPPIRPSTRPGARPSGSGPSRRPTRSRRCRTASPTARPSAARGSSP
jgi:hypothetical protein